MSHIYSRSFVFFCLLWNSSRLWLSCDATFLHILPQSLVFHSTFDPGVKTLRFLQIHGRRRFRMFGLFPASSWFFSPAFLVFGWILWKSCSWTQGFGSFSRTGRFWFRFGVSWFGSFCCVFFCLVLADVSGFSSKLFISF